MTPPLHSLPAGTEAIVMGASSGAVEVLLRLLPRLPADYPLPIALVVHLPPDGDSALAALLDARCSLRVKEAEDKEPLTPGTVHLAPPNYHLLVEPDHRLSLSCDEPVLWSRPSIDVLFESAAEAYGPALAGVVLTGASADGASGLRAIGATGGFALVQDPATAEASIMPQAARDATPSARALSVEEIGRCLASAAPHLTR